VNQARQHFRHEAKGAVKILDLACQTSQEHHATSGRNDARRSETLLLTVPGPAVGTIYYMSRTSARRRTRPLAATFSPSGGVLIQIDDGKLPFYGGSTSAVSSTTFC